MDILKHIEQNRFAGYSYSYPHKHAYGKLPAAVSISHAWERENRDSLFLYIHIPFCEMRCSFCNLFTLPRPGDDLISEYLDALQLQAEIVSRELHGFKISRVAIGGGTPTILTVNQLERLLNMITRLFHVDFNKVPCSIECSPATVTEEKVQLLRQRGISRISIGIQSFIENETRKMGRPDSTEYVRKVLTLLRDAAFPRFNIDLIYGYDNQDIRSLEYSIKSLSNFGNNEVFLYPLYIRPLTACSGTLKNWEDARIDLYESGRNLLHEMGFSQMSMRFFKKEEEDVDSLPEYCCQQDGMIGLGAGARSYTQNLHYSFEYAVSRKSTKDIIQKYCSTEASRFATIDYGIYLNKDEQKRRTVIKSLLHVEGLDRQWYFHIFKTDVLSDFPVLKELSGLNVVSISEIIRLTQTGLGYSDAIGPLFYSEEMRTRMDLFQLS